MAYFRCTTGGSGKGNTLVVTCADDLAGATITCTNGTKTYTKTCPSTAPYEVTFYGLAAGTWTVSATVSGNTYTTTVVITDYEAELGGFNWKAWVDLSQNYTSSDFTDLDDLLSDETAIRELMTIHACVDYLADIAATSADVETIIGNDLAAKWINLRDYALDTLYANTIIKGYMDTADKYGYGEWALVGQVPKMTSATAPYGTAFGNGSYTDNPPYYVFDDNDSTLGSGIASASTSGAYIGYHFVNPIKITRVSIKVAYAYSTQCIIQGSNTGNANDYVDLKEFTIVNSDGLVNVDFANENEYSYYRIYQKSTTTAHRFGTNSIQFYAWAPKGNVPVMTSNTAPYGTVSANAEITPAWNAFDGNPNTYWQTNTTSGVYLAYKFTNPVCAKRLYISNFDAAGRILTFAIQVSNDGSTWVNVDSNKYSYTNPTSGGREGAYLDFNNDSYYLYYRVAPLTLVTTTYTTIGMLQFYGRELKVSVPTMTSNTSPYGEAIGTNQYSSDYTYYKAFNGSNSSYCNLTSVGSYCGYDFITPKVIKRIKYRSSSDASLKNQSFLIKGSNDKIDWTDLSDTLSTSEVSKDYCYDINPNDSEFRYYAVFVVSGLVSNQFVICEVQFYGLDYSEKEFEEGTTKKWLYDHGVELEQIVDCKDDSWTITSGYTWQSVNKQSNDIIIDTNAANTTSMVSTKNAIDVTNYSMGCIKANAPYLDANTFVYALYNAKNTASGAVSYITALQKGKEAMSVLNISSINQSVYIGVQARDNQYDGVLTELWLE